MLLVETVKDCKSGDLGTSLFAQLRNPRPSLSLDFPASKTKTFDEMVPRASFSYGGL